MPSSTTRFTDRVADYIKARPSYPREMLDVLAHKIGFNDSRSVVDIGAGTGISTRLFLDRGNTVFAVEPNQAMREAAVAEFGGDPKFHAIDGTAEATTLPARSIDLIVAAQAFHWFDRVAFAAECRRIARPDGHLLLLWNERIAVGSPFAVAYERLLLDFATDYTRVDHRTVTREQIAEAFAVPPELIEMPNAQSLDYGLLEARLMSSSYVPNQNDPRHARLMAELRSVFDRTALNGRVTMEYRTQMYLGSVHAGTKG